MSKIQFEFNKNKLSVFKSKNLFIKDWIYFILYSIIIFGSFFLYSIYVNMNEDQTLKFSLFVLILIIGYYLINRKNLNKRLFEIEKLGSGDFCINKEFRFHPCDRFYLVIYEYVGELFLNIIGNIFLSVGRNEIRLVNGIYDEDIKIISDALKRFLEQEEIKIVYKKIL